jgi:hypothetical protein
MSEVPLGTLIGGAGDSGTAVRGTVLRITARVRYCIGSRQGARFGADTVMMLTEDGVESSCAVTIQRTDSPGSGSGSGGERERGGAGTKFNPPSQDHHPSKTSPVTFLPSSVS